MSSDHDVRANRHHQLSGRSVTRHDAEKLSEDVLAGRRTWQQTSADAIALVERVDAENRIVNDWLLWLYYLGRFEERRRSEAIHEARQGFRDALDRYDADRDGWELRYVLSMVVGLWTRVGREEALQSARGHVRRGMLTEKELLDFLGRAPEDGSPPPVG